MKANPSSPPSLPAFFEAIGGWMKAALATSLPRQEPWDYLYALARDYPERGGKHMRPVLLVLSAEIFFPVPWEKLEPSACALELFQNFALVHDDIEDASLLRRGKPTLHKSHGIPLALNAGDLLFALCHEALGRNEAVLGAAQAWEVQRAFTQAFRHTLEGQGWDIGWREKGVLPDKAGYYRMVECKTGWYSGKTPCEVGALLGGASAEAREKMGRFGLALGIGFQLRDDILNLSTQTGHEAPTPQGGGYGKELGGDIAEGKTTLIVLEMLERLEAQDRERLEQIIRTPPLQTREADIGWAIQQAHSSGALAAVQGVCEAYFSQAFGHLKAFPPSPQRERLEALTALLGPERKA